MGGFDKHVLHIPEHAFMTTVLDRSVEVKVGNANGIANGMPGYRHVTSVGCREQRFVLFRPKKIDGMTSPVLLNQTGKMAIECGLRRLRTGDLNALPERLDPLLLPEHWR